MADNTVLDAGSGGDTIATDDIGGVKFQRVKVCHGADGSSTDVSSASPMPVTVASITAGDNNIGNVDVVTLPALPAGTNNVGDVDIASIAAGDNNIGNVDIASALPAGTNNIGDVDVLTLPGVAGNVAHDAADSGNPVKVGGVARTADPTAVAASDRVDASHDILGKQLVQPYAAGDNIVQGVTAAITGTSNTEVIAAAGSGVRIYVTSLTVTNSHATVSTVVELKDGTTVIHRGYALAAGGGYTVTFPSPLRLTANTALNAANITTGSNTYVSASGFKAAA